MEHLIIYKAPSSLVEETNQEERQCYCDTLWNGASEVPMPRRDTPFMTLVQVSVVVKNVQLRPHEEVFKAFHNEEFESTCGAFSDLIIIVNSPEVCVNSKRSCDEDCRRDYPIQYNSSQHLICEPPSHQVSGE